MQELIWLFSSVNSQLSVHIFTSSTPLFCTCRFFFCDFSLVGASRDKGDKHGLEKAFLWLGSTAVYLRNECLPLLWLVCWCLIDRCWWAWIAHNFWSLVISVSLAAAQAAACAELSLASCECLAGKSVKFLPCLVSLWGLLGFLFFKIYLCWCMLPSAHVFLLERGWPNEVLGGSLGWGVTVSLEYEIRPGRLVSLEQTFPCVVNNIQIGCR